MTFAQARQVLEVYLNNNWSLTPIVWQNVEAIDFAESGQPKLAEGTDPFISINIFIHNSNTITVPGNCIRYPGTIEFDIYVKEGTGARESSELLDNLIAIFENKTIGTHPDKIRVRNITTAETVTDESGWHIQLVGFSMYFERFISNP